MSADAANQGKIDTHIHIIPPYLRKLLNQNGGDPSGWHIPDWTSETAISALDEMGIEKAYFSVTAPGPSIAGPGAEGRKAARTINLECLDLIMDHPQRFALFASTPNWCDVEGTLAEIEWALVEQSLPGIVIMTSYSERLLGDPLFDKIWRRLNELEAVVFIHPSDLAVQPKFVAGKLSQPWVDYPHATTRTALDLVLNGTTKRYTSVKIILSHAGGTLPFLNLRMLSMSQHLEGFPVHEDLKQGLQTFYLDLALSTSYTNLIGVLEFTSPDKILFGSDWPYAPFGTSKDLTKRFEAFLNSEEGKKLQGAVRNNAIELFGSMR